MSAVRDLGRAARICRGLKGHGKRRQGVAARVKPAPGAGFRCQYRAEAAGGPGAADGTRGAAETGWYWEPAPGAGLNRVGNGLPPLAVAFQAAATARTA